jgi:hypothetical protein
MRPKILTKQVMSGIPVLVIRLECRSHRSPTWLRSRYTEGALLTGSDQPA